METIKRFLEKASQTNLGFYDRVVTAYNAPAPLFNLIYIRVFVCLFFIWKILSRDFELFGTLPVGVLYYYPYEIYNDYMLTAGLPGIMELLTFHWIHFITGMPGELTIHYVKLLAIATCAVYAVFGAGPKRVFAISTYILIMYLWGFVYMFGQDVDSVFIHQGVLFCMLFSAHADIPLWRIGKKDFLPTDMNAGRCFSAIVLIFVLYYFGSGVNKLSDISLIEWFQYRLVESIEWALEYARVGGMTQPPDIFSYLEGQYWINYLAVPAVYLSHLIVPLVFFRRRLIYKFAVFYACFHLMTLGVGIAFTGYIFVWTMLFNVSAMVARPWSRNAKEAYA